MVSPRLPRPVVGLIVALAGGTVLAGCAADESSAERPAAPPEASATSTPSATASPTPAPSVATPPARPAAGSNKAAAEAFARYVVDAWAYSLATNDASLFSPVSPGGRPCRACRQQAVTLADRATEGWSVHPFEVIVEKVRLSPSPDGVTAEMRIDIPETRSYFDDGTYRNTSPAHEDATFTVSMVTTPRGYRLAGWSLR